MSNKFTTLATSKIISMFPKSFQIMSQTFCPELQVSPKFVFEMSGFDLFSGFPKFLLQFLSWHSAIFKTRIAGFSLLIWHSQSVNEIAAKDDVI